MGMFDTISVADQLPYTDEMKELGLDKSTRTWQTKDLECYMANYVLQNGELFEQKYKNVLFKEPDPNATYIMEKIGYPEYSGPYLDKVNFHGEIYFYDYICDVQEKWDCWIEFKAVFTNGKVDKLELVKFEKRDAQERKKKDSEFLARIGKENNLWYNKYIFYTKPCRYIRVKWNIFCLKASSFFQNITL